MALDDPKAGATRGWHRGLAALAADGVALDLVALYDHFEEPEQHVPAPAHAVLVGGANVGKPYPPVNGNNTIAPQRVRVPAPVVPSTPVTHSAPAAPVVHSAPSAPVVHSAPSAPVPAAPRQEESIVNVAHNGVQSHAAVMPPAAAPPQDEHWTPAAAPLSADAWSVIDRIQQETAKQHERYLDVVTHSHQTFLETAAQMMAEIVGDHSATSQAPRPVVQAQLPAPAAPRALTQPA
ncbi:MAG: hypothetical protein NT146_15090, partial [Mycobacterium sp.]|nr:hypothetical protein [Mycobacterium sp.]